VQSQLSEWAVAVLAVIVFSGAAAGMAYLLLRFLREMNSR
jgi:hypothetical protein